MAPLRTSFEKAPPSVLRVAGVAISHPERSIEVAPGHTKLDVVRYHESMAAWLLPQLAPRPITIVKFDEARFQERRENGVAHAGREEDDDNVGNVRARLRYRGRRARRAERHCEFQTWGASFPRLERPDRMTLDLTRRRSCRGALCRRPPMRCACCSTRSASALS